MIVPEMITAEIESIQTTTTMTTMVEFKKLQTSTIKKSNSCSHYSVATADTDSITISSDDTNKSSRVVRFADEQQEQEDGHQQQQSYLSNTNEKCSHDCNRPTRKQHFCTLGTIRFLHDVPCASQMNKSEKQLLWWTKSELRNFKRLALQVCKAAQRRPARAQGADKSHETILGKVYDSCCLTNATFDNFVTAQDCDSLTTWFRNSHMRRGLEIYIHPVISKERICRRECVRHAVLVLQQNGKLNNDIKAETIRKCSERLTQPSRLFARALAMADEACSSDTRHSSGALQVATSAA